LFLALGAAGTPEKENHHGNDDKDEKLIGVGPEGDLRGRALGGIAGGLRQETCKT
jgi:hypothetical protein